MSYVRIGLVALAIGAGAACGARADNLDQQLVAEAPKVLKFLEEKGYQSVGVLKFRALKGDGRPTDRIGPLNLNLARRLETALILASRPTSSFKIVHDASAVAAGISGASHLDDAGRQRLFAGRYPVAWGQEELTPDAFVTGIVALSPDLQRLTVSIGAFGRKAPLEPVVKFEADIDPFALTDSGASFVVRGALANHEQQLARVVKTAKAVDDGQQLHPLLDPNAPVELFIYYGRQVIKPEIAGGQASIPEPREDQPVTFVIRHRGLDVQRYGIVLRVNGLNTHNKQRLPDLECTKWILEPSHPQTPIAGFQIDGRRAEAFKVLSPAESKEREMDYGADVGTISMVVFRDEGSSQPSVGPETDEDVLALLRGVFPDKSPNNLAALQHQLRNSGTRSASRGIIESGATIGQQIRTVEFNPNPVPVMSATVTYYKPRS